jgi:biopolymer transport protein ExbB/TolQ
MPSARDTVGGAHLDQVLIATAWGLAWAAIAFVGYRRLRRTRA